MALEEAAGTLLGQIILFRIENTRVRHEDLAAWFTEFDLDRSFLPPPPRAIDAFKKATGTTEKLTYAAPWHREGAMVKVQWAEDSQNPDRIVRRAERTITIRKNTNEPETIGRVTFYKRARRSITGRPGGERLRFYPANDRLAVPEQALIAQWFKDTNTRYHAGLEWFDTQALRAVVRNYLTECMQGLRVRDGNYFVFPNMAEDSAKVAQLVARCGPECLFHPVELLDTTSHRQLLATTVTNESEAHATALLRDLSAISRKFPAAVPARRVAPLLVRYEALLEMIHRFTLALGGGDAVCPFARMEAPVGAPAIERLTDLVVSVKERIE